MVGEQPTHDAAAACAHALDSIDGLKPIDLQPYIYACHACHACHAYYIRMTACMYTRATAQLYHRNSSSATGRRRQRHRHIITLFWRTLRQMEICARPLHTLARHAPKGLQLRARVTAEAPTQCRPQPRLRWRAAVVIAEIYCACKADSHWRNVRL